MSHFRKPSVRQTTSSRNSAQFSRVRACPEQAKRAEGDLARSVSHCRFATLRARSLAPLEKARGFGMTFLVND